MNELCNLSCSPCRGGDPPIDEAELEKRRAEIPDWDVIHENGIRKLRRSVRVKNFAKALELTNLIGELAERHGHHPVICTEWGRITITWWTHAISDLHLNDCILAAKTDQVLTM